ncbi:phosphopantetheine-binding protein [Nocardia sp. NPDC051030]|uniref:phosphopantetheine-binding protein n=1 Tax=Nocardia sp. NPDC051030 TaxID=3155162 RepID=UPI003426009B
MGLTREQVIADIADLLYADPAELTENADLAALGLDSLCLATLVDRWRVAGAVVQFEDLAEQPTLGAWLTYLL